MLQSNDGLFQSQGHRYIPFQLLQSSKSLRKNKEQLNALKNKNNSKEGIIQAQMVGSNTLLDMS